MVVGKSKILRIVTSAAGTPCGVIIKNMVNFLKGLLAFNRNFFSKLIVGKDS